MAQDEVNFPFDQEKTSALRGLVQSREEVAQPRRLDDEEEDLRNPGRARDAAAEEERDVSRPEQIKDRVEITQDAFDQNQAAERNRAETQTAEVQQGEAQQEVDQQEKNQVKAIAEQRIESEYALQRNRTEPAPNNNSESAQVADPGDSDPEESLNEGFRLGKTQRNPNSAVEFSVRNQIDTPEEAVAATNELDSNPAFRARKVRNETRDTGNEIADSPERQKVQLQQRVETDSAEIRGAEEVEIQEDNFSEIRANVPEVRTEQKAEDAREAARNEPSFDIPVSYVEQIEKARDPLQEAQDTNSLRAPAPSEIRDEPDATAVETERGQNVSNLI
jgi:hypothetical protein